MPALWRSQPRGRITLMTSRRWTSFEKWGTGIAVLTLVVGSILVPIFVPEVRVWLRLEKPVTSHPSVSIPGPTNPVVPASQPTTEPTPTPTPKVSQRSNVHVKGSSNVVGNSVSGSRNVVGNNNEVTASRPVAVAPNGIAIAGGTVTNPTVNNFGPPQRAISDQDKLVLTARLSQHPGQVAFGAITSDPSSETFKFAQILYDIFQSSGWRMQGPIAPMMYGGKPWKGVMIDYKGEPNTATSDVREIGSALDEANIKTIWFHAAPDYSDYMRIVVGPNPEQ
jgi:hypothetical protein